MFIVLQALYYERTACERSNLFRTFYYKLEEYVGDELHTKVDRKLYISLLENLIRTFFFGRDLLAELYRAKLLWKS